MYYKLLGFSHSGSNRVFSFDRIEKNMPPVRFSVTADLAAAHRNELALQELPGLCARFLESRPETETSADLRLTEAQMSEFAIETALAAATVAATRARRFGRRQAAEASTHVERATTAGTTLFGSTTLAGRYA